MTTPEKMHQTGASFHTRATGETKGNTPEIHGLESIYTMPTPQQVYADTNDSQEQHLAQTQENFAQALGTPLQQVPNP